MGGKKFNADRVFDFHDGRVHVFTDGSAKKVHGRYIGSWAAIMFFGDHVKELYGVKDGTTVNEMELTAIYEAMKALSAKPHGKDVIITSDSQYSVFAITRWHIGWERNNWEYGSNGLPIANVEVHRKIRNILEPWMHLKWVKGHSGHAHNDWCDRKCRELRKDLERQISAEAAYQPKKIIRTRARIRPEDATSARA